MSGGVLLGVALALLASIALNASFLLQHLGSRTAVNITLRRPAASLRGLLGSRLWLAGSAAGLAGWGVPRRHRRRPRGLRRTARRLGRVFRRARRRVRSRRRGRAAALARAGTDG
jgi:hypothetical protein